jgi:hypothetical protein
MNCWNPAALDDLASDCRIQRTTGLLVIRNRQKILERNRPAPADSDFLERLCLQGTAREHAASQQESLVALLAAIAIDRGLLDFDLLPLCQQEPALDLRERRVALATTAIVQATGE